MVQQQFDNERSPSRPPFRPIVVAGVYALVSALWILSSDEIVVRLFGDTPDLLQLVSSVKGEAFVGATAWVLYVVLRAWEARFLHAQARVEAAAVRNRELFESNPLPILAYDEQTRQIVEANRAAEELYGYARGALRGLRMSDLVVDEPAADDGSPIAGVGRHRACDGRIIEVSVATHAADLDGRRNHLVGVMDLTEIRRAEAAVARSETTYRHILDAIDDVVWLADVQTGKLEYISPAASRVYGVGPNDLMVQQQAWLASVHPDDRWIAMAKAARVGAGESAWAEYRLLRADGAVLWVLDRTNVIRDESGTPVRLVGIATDITERRRSEEEMRLASNVFEHAAEGIVVTDARERIIRVNQAFTTITGYSREEIVGRTPRQVASGRHDAAFYREMWSAIRTNGRWEGEVWNRRKDGEIYPQWLSVTALLDPVGTLTHYVGIFYDLSDRKRAEADIHRLAWYDTLTQLPNRSLAVERITQATKDVSLHGGKLALLCLDVDRFKLVNDSMGHAAGDAVLREVAHRVSCRVRPFDSVFRGSGAQFLVLMQRLEDERQVESIATEILESIHLPFLVEGTELRLTASAGAAEGPQDGEDAETLIRNAEAALYQAKHLGRNRCEFFNSAISTGVAERLRMENRLRVALERQEFEVHYQPQVDIASGSLLGVEALLRWRHPEDGLIPPNRFIPVAEECGLIVSLGEWVLREACRDAVAWELTHRRPLKVAVNISAMQFRQADFGETIACALADSGLNPAQLELELTESIVMDGATPVLRTLEALKVIGVSLSLDDFGTGYSSLAYLRRFPLDKLKIDRSFVSRVPSDAGDAAIALAVIGIARSLGLSVIAEGVESDEQARFLLENGCPEAQGFRYARPMPIIEVAAWAAARSAA